MILISVLEVELRLRVLFFVPAFASEARFDILAGFKPEIVRVVEETTASVGSLETPAEFKEDHEVLVDYLAEQLESTRMISELPSSRTASLEGPPGVLASNTVWPGRRSPTSSYVS